MRDKKDAHLHRDVSKLAKDAAIAEDDTGATYDYGQEGFPDERGSPAAREWLAVEPKPDDVGC